MLTTDEGFIVEFRNDFKRSFNGFLAVTPPSNIGMFEQIPTAAAAAASTRPPSRSSPPGQPPVGIPFEIGAGMTAVPFRFLATSVNFPSGNFTVLAFAGAPHVTPVVLSAQVPLMLNVKLDLKLLPQRVPGTSFESDIIVERANHYSENALIRITAQAKYATGTLTAGDTLRNFTGPVIVEEEFLEPLQNAYTPSADSPGRDPLPKGEKGFFQRSGARIGPEGLPFPRGGGLGGPGTEDFVAKSFREPTKNEQDQGDLEAKSAMINGRLVGEFTPRGSIEVRQWVDRITRSREGRAGTPNSTVDWLEEHVWDILARDPTQPPALPDAEERLDIVSCVFAINDDLGIVPGPRGEPVPGKTFPSDPRGGGVIRIYPFFQNWRADRSVPEKGIRHFVSNIVLHEARHAWQLFLLTVTTRTPTVQGPLPDNVLSDGETDTRILGLLTPPLPPLTQDFPNNDDDPLLLNPLTEKLELSRDLRGDELPEKIFRRTRQNGTMLIDLAQAGYLDASLLVDDDTPVLRRVVPSAPTILDGLFTLRSTVDDITERDASSFGDLFETDE